MAAESTALIDAGVLFATVALAGVVANRINQSVIPFYILGGILLGPYVLGELPEVVEDVAGPGIDLSLFGYDLIEAVGAVALAETDFIHLGAELGIVLLLFFLGLEFNLERLIAARDRIGKAGTVDLAINFGVGLVLGWLLFRAFLPAFLAAGVVYISSSAIITKSLIDLGWIANDEADPMLGTLVYEDLFIAVYLAIATALVMGGGDVGEALGQIGVAVGFILALLVVVYVGTSWFQRSLETDSHEFLVLRALGITTLVSGAALALGVSEAVAAFFVGMAFSATDHVHDLENLLEPVRDTFAAVFFFWIGLITDPGVFLDAFVLAAIAAAVVLTAPSKLVSGYLGGRIYDLSERRSLRVGLGMTTRGEFSLIIASIAIGGAGIGLTEGTAEALYAFAVGYVLVMSILGTTLMQYSSEIESVVVPRLEARHETTARPSDD
ncbi:potassium/proton antiporter membrane subunit, CPA2 family [Halobiforma haloterrestris]|uniref:Potassium/proton antiporter membrane subunit, CPA2 family n=1 Tax=Natronobacterium haloterrestre TaxID=148448 RepID=A0A1I1KDA5_NATHA|nr:cation:proton antiporter [Halobiforma haloterrestris]SFC58954.1 potassium/proton antiporter membrane subunit, CPA2 family [Halobiforma haloterrestris]